MSHAYHDILAGYDSRQIWHDGCLECEGRGLSVPASLGALDDDTLLRAINRARQFHNGDVKHTGEISSAELDLLKHLEGCLQVMRRLRYMGYRVEDIK
jgi:hypothetical protein